jgi:hypothetical protein
MLTRFRACVAAALTVVLGFSSCATKSVIESRWELPGYVEEGFSELAVIALMKDQGGSKSFETAIVDRFSKAGIECTPGFSFLDEEPLGKEEMEKRVAATGAPAVLMFKLIAVDMNMDYVPPTKYSTRGARYPYWWEDPYWGYYRPYPHSYWGYWYPAIQVIDNPGYWASEVTYRVEITLYRISDSRLVWTATSKTYDPEGDYDLGTSLASPVLKELQARGFVPVK